MPYEKRETVLFCPLNWGLGHATRIVPLIQKEIDLHHRVIIATDSIPEAFLKSYFPKLTFLYLPSYNIKYSRSQSQIWAMCVAIPKITLGIIREHFWLKKIVKKHQIDRIVSDNRFGMWHRKVHSTYITHQIMVKMPRNINFLEYPVYRLHRFFINKYNQCLIPDFENKPHLAGDLAHKYPLTNNAHFIGVLSRFSLLENVQPNRTFQRLIILSGVEPQRTIFSDEMIAKYANDPANTLLVEGRPDTKRDKKKVGNITLASHLSDDEFAAIVAGCDTIICRAGYSSVMDLYTLNALHKALFYPTPGQTEQEYLAKYLTQNKIKKVAERKSTAK